MEKKLLEVGDVLHECYHGSPTGKQYEIDRVTKVFAFRGQRKFRRELSDSNIAYMYHDSSVVYSYYLNTPDLAKEAERKLLIEEIRQTIWHRIVYDDVKAIHGILFKKEAA